MKIMQNIKSQNKSKKERNTVVAFCHPNYKERKERKYSLLHQASGPSTPAYCFIQRPGSCPTGPDQQGRGQGFSLKDTNWLSISNWESSFWLAYAQLLKKRGQGFNNKFLAKLFAGWRKQAREGPWHSTALRLARTRINSFTSNSKGDKIMLRVRVDLYM